MVIVYILQVVYKEKHEIMWINDIPADEPYCGFDNSKCTCKSKICVTATAMNVYEIGLLNSELKGL